MTKPLATVEQAFTLHAAGASQAAISRSLGVSRAAVRAWLARGLDGEREARAGRAACDTGTCPRPSAVSQPAYAYLLGLYLGDGCLSPTPRGSSWVLRIACCDDYPGLIAECEEAIRTVAPGRPVIRMPRGGYHEVASRDQHWRCLFPQHGRGRKHTRPIALAPWQVAIVTAHPRELIRGLLHSDGCRVTNRVRTASSREHAYPRYLFANNSVDIQRILTDALDLLGIPWRNNGWNSVSVARREGVAALDEFVGPKA